jgi:hypothetical protein
MFIYLLGMREIPVGGLRMEIAAAFQYGGAGMFVQVFVCPLPDITAEVFDAE